MYLDNLKDKLLSIFQIDAVHLCKMLFKTLSRNFGAAQEAFSKSSSLHDSEIRQRC